MCAKLGELPTKGCRKDPSLGQGKGEESSRERYCGSSPETREGLFQVERREGKAVWGQVQVVYLQNFKKYEICRKKMKRMRMSPRMTLEERKGWARLWASSYSWCWPGFIKPSDENSRSMLSKEEPWLLRNMTTDSSSKDDKLDCHLLQP